jgi:hypothetical protein
MVVGAAALFVAMIACGSGSQGSGVGESQNELSSTPAQAVPACGPGKKACYLGPADGICQPECVIDTALCVSTCHPVCDPDKQPRPGCQWNAQTCSWDCPVCDPDGPAPRPACQWNIQTCAWDCPVCDPDGPAPQPDCQWDSQHCLWVCL